MNDDDFETLREETIRQFFPDARPEAERAEDIRWLIAFFVAGKHEACGMAFDFGRVLGNLELRQVLLDKQESESSDETVARLSAENKALRKQLEHTKGCDCLPPHTLDCPANTSRIWPMMESDPENR